MGLPAPVERSQVLEDLRATRERAPDLQVRAPPGQM